MGYVLNTEAIRAVHGGRRFLSAPLVDSVIDRFVSKDASDDPLLRPRKTMRIEISVSAP